MKNQITHKQITEMVIAKLVNYGYNKNDASEIATNLALQIIYGKLTFEKI